MKSFQTILLVMVFFFGLMFLTRGCQGDPEQTQRSISSNANDDSLSKSGLYDEEEALATSEALPAIIAEAGTPDSQSGITTLANDKVNLQLFTTEEGKDSIEGTVLTASGKAIAFADVIAANFPEDWTDDDKVSASDNVRQIVETTQRRGQFSKFYAPNEAEPIVLSNNLMSVRIRPLGGSIDQVTLADYYNYPDNGEKTNVEMFSKPFAQHTDPFFYRYNLRTANQQTHSTADLYFTPKKIDDNTVEMSLEFDNGATWGYRYTLAEDSYVVKLEVIQHDMADILASSMTEPEFRMYELMPRQDKSRTFEERNSGIYYKPAGDSPDNLGGNDSKTKVLKGNVEWVAFKNQFFSTVFIPNEPFSGGEIAQVDLKDYQPYVDYVKEMDAVLNVPYNINMEVAASFDIYIGPNAYPILSDLDDQIGREDQDFTRLIPLGWSWLRWINTVIIIPIFNFLSGFNLNYGIIILILTIIIKIILFPFTYKSYKSQAKMRVLAPDIKKINEDYPGKENALTRQNKTMKLYSEAGASPLSGCLPLLLQMPILIAMFSFFPSCIELRGQSFLWVKDLAAPDYICTLPFTIPFYGNHVSLFCLLMTITNVAYTYINMKSQPNQSSMPGMKWMMYLMPVMFLFFFNDYAAALSYYYFLSLLITIIQTWIFRRCVNEQKVRARIEENRKNPKPKKKSGFMARLEEAQRRQQAELQKRQGRPSSRKSSK